MNFKIGDIVYSRDLFLLRNCGDLHKYPAVFVGEDETGLLKLRFFNYNYSSEEYYHGSKAEYVFLAPPLIRELL